MKKPGIGNRLLRSNGRCAACAFAALGRESGIANSRSAACSSVCLVPHHPFPIPDSAHAPPIPDSRVPIPGSQSGFTLIEVVLATALLALGLVLAFATLRTAAGSAQRGEALAQRTDRVRAVQQFLRRQLQTALPMPFERDEDSGQVVVFRGDGERIEFVANMPGYLSRGGAYKQSLRLVRDGPHYRLEFDHRMLLAGDEREDDEREPEVLLDNIDEAQFEFRALDADGVVGDWSSQAWETPEQLPMVLRLRLRFADAQRWPDFEVPLTLRSAPGGMGMEAVFGAQEGAFTK